MNSVRWLKLELSGFGLYRDARIDFPQELAVFVAPNEAGKSTAVAGLTAVVFGLPTNSDPSGWGNAKYRSYSANTKFTGRVEFEARDGRRVEIRRDFESHGVTVACLEQGQQETLFSGTHNPGARKGTGQYEKLLGELVGLTSAELFRQSFSIEQPLRTEEGLSHDVAGLLAGSGGGSHRSALEYLESQVERRTRFTGELGLTSRNKNKDRELEELEREIGDLEQAIVEGRDAADGLQKVQGELVELGAEKELLKQRAARLRSKEQSTGDWLRAQEAYARAHREFIIMEGKLETAKAESLRVEKLKQVSAGETKAVEGDWSFVEGKAASYLRGRRDDARDALEEFRLFQTAREDVEATRSQLDEYHSLEQATPQLLEEIRSHSETEKRLEADVEQARGHLLDLERHALDNDPSRGFEDVADLDEEQLGRLRREATRQPRAGLLGGALGALIGLALALFLRAELPLTLLLVAGLFGAGFGIQSAIAGRGKRVLEARHRLERYGRWHRQAVNEKPTDLTPHRDRLQQVEEVLSSFRERILPYRSEYGDLSAAYASFESLRRGLVEQQGAVGRYARDFWKVEPREVEGVDPLSAGGCWQRSGDFVTAIGRERGTVAALVSALESLEKQWEDLAADASAWDEVAVARSERERALANSEAVLLGILSAEGVDNLEELREKVSAKQLDAVDERNRFKEVCDLNPELPRFDDPADRRGEVVENQRRYEAESSEVTGELGLLEERIQGLLRQRAEKQGANPANIASLEVQLAELHERRKELQFEVDAYALAYRTMDDASREYQDEYLDRLSELTSSYFSDFTGRQERQVVFEVDFGVRVVENGGVELDPKRLSQGAQDQLVLAARLAIADMIAADVQLPLVFDDPFQNCDAERLMRIRETLEQVALERQVILLSHEDRFLAWGEPVEIVRESPPEMQSRLSLAATDD